MIDNSEKILLAYQKSDFNERLHLYLEYPSLRRVFLVLDQAETGAQDAHETNTRREAWSPSILVTTIAFFFKRVFRFGSVTF